MKKSFGSSSISGVIVCLALGALVTTGCKKDDKKADEKAAAAASADDKKSKSRSKTAEDEGIEVPTEEDFEETVHAQITVDSDLKKELDELEKQITQ